MLSIVGLSSCLGGVEFELNFVVDGEAYDTIKTSGNEIVKIPTDPTKEGYTFDGWYWDNGVWEKPFTANSLLDAPISSNMSIYAKWDCIHTASDWITDSEATCKAEGARHKECTKCEEVLETGTIEKLTTHTPAEAVKENFVDSDCETEGSYNSVVYCSVCEKKISSEAKVVEKKEHTPSDWITDSEATCKVEGTKHKECTKCEEVLETGTIEKLTTHTPAEAVKENFVDSDCETEGSYNSVVYCSVCEKKISSEAKVVEKKAHTPSGWIEDTPATCKTEGTKHKECTECEEVVESESIPKTNDHTSVIDLMVMPTKTTTGLTEGAHCSECGEVIIKQVVISKLQSSTSEYRVDGNYIYFGEYPQTIKANDVIMTSAKDSRGYYLGSDGYYYAKVTANPYEDNYSFSNGESVENGEIYYFKVEPIKWKIVMLDNIYYTVVCDSIIANAMFSTSTNSYGSSYLKTFITNFINGKAFSDRQNSMIMEGPHPFTKDAVADFNDDEMTKITTDYARATGAFMSTEKENYGVGKWWLRTAGSTYNAYYVDAYGGVYSTHVQSKGVGVVISMVVELNPFFA